MRLQTGVDFIAEAINDAVSACEPALHGLLYQNVFLTGAGSQFGHLRRRVERELRSMAPDEYVVTVGQAEDPVNHAWHGGARLGILLTTWVRRATLELHCA